MTVASDPSLSIPHHATSEPLRIGLLTTSASRRGGGVFEAVVNQARLIRDLGHHPIIFALEDGQGGADRDRLDGAELVTCPRLGPGAIGYSPRLIGALKAHRLDRLHLHGIWQYPSAAGAAWARATGRPYIISPHGMLDPWILSRGRLKKAVARLGYERRSWRRATLFHALTEREAADIGAAEPGVRTVTIPNAVDLAPKSMAREERVLYLGRIHPKKNLGAVLEGWRAARDVLAPRGARLDIAGWGDPADVAAFEARLAAMADPTVHFHGPVFGTAKAELLARARFMILASFSEGLPMALLEAWAAGTPTLMSTECNLPDGFSAGAAMDCGMDAQSVAMCLRAAFSLSDSGWTTMSTAAINLVRRHYSHDTVAARWAEAYQGCRSRDP